MKRTHIIFLCAVLLCGCAAQPEVTEPPVAATVATVATVPAALPVAETQTPTEPQPQWVAHSGIRADGSFSEGTLFFGDSLTYDLLYNRLEPAGLLGDARHIAICGATLSRFFWDRGIGVDKLPTFCTKEFYGLTIPEALEQAGESISTVYFMLGTNYNEDTDTAHYIRIVDYLLTACPNATIYLQKVPYSRESFVRYDAANACLEEVEDHYLQQGVPRVMLLDTYSVIGENLVDDGIHLNEAGMDAWYAYLISNAKELGLPE